MGHTGKARLIGEILTSAKELPMRVSRPLVENSVPQINSAQAAMLALPTADQKFLHVRFSFENG
jgi:hypothetical protein